jgi:hypothetical protein
MYLLGLISNLELPDLEVAEISAIAWLSHAPPSSRLLELKCLFR